MIYRSCVTKRTHVLLIVWSIDICSNEKTCPLARLHYLAGENMSWKELCTICRCQLSLVCHSRVWWNYRKWFDYKRTWMPEYIKSCIWNKGKNLHLRKLNNTYIMLTNFFSGTIGFFACFFFVRKIYGSVKVDWQERVWNHAVKYLILYT